MTQTKQEDAEYVELLWPVVPNEDDVDGWLDWFTGVMALNVSHEDWRDLDQAPPPVRTTALRTYAHERFHFLQFAMLGFMHDWAAELFDLVRPVVKRSHDTQGPQDFAGVKRLIAKGDALLTDAERTTLAMHFAKLDNPGKSGLTARAIFESHAYFVERAWLHDLEKPHEWTAHLRAAPAPIYRIAFDVLAYTAGFGVAFDWFCAVASLSLCSEDPPTTFEALALALAAMPVELKATPGSGEDMIAVLKEELAVDLNCPVEHLRVRHPMFSDAAIAIRKAINDDRTDLGELFARPQAELATLREDDALSPPIIFKPAGTSQLAIQANEGQAQGDVFALFTMGAVGQRLTQQLATKSRTAGDGHLARLSWVVRDHDIVMFDLAPEDLHSGNPSRMVMIFDPHDEMAEQKLKMWGRAVLRLPRELDPTQDAWLPTVPPARTLLKAINERLPMFPLYLSPAVNAFYEWFGSIAPESHLINGQLDTSHPELATLVDRAETAMNDAGRASNMNPWLAIQCLLAPFHLSRAAAL